MIAYGIGILPLIKNLKREIPDITQSCYADDAGALGMVAIIETYFNLLTHQGPGRGYHHEPSKNLLILHPENLEARNCLSHVTDLRCAQERIILGVTLGMTSPKAIG